MRLVFDEPSQERAGPRRLTLGKIEVREAVACGDAGVLLERFIRQDLRLGARALVEEQRAVVGLVLLDREALANARQRRRGLSAQLTWRAVQLTWRADGRPR